jgi:DNA processing protein
MRWSSPANRGARTIRVAIPSFDIAGGRGIEFVDGACERTCLIALHLVPGLGPTLIARLVRTLGSAGAAWRAPASALIGIRGIGPHRAASIVRARDRVDVEGELRRADRVGARVLTWLDLAYPAALRDLADAPPVIYVRGAWTPGPGPAAAVVGMRRASSYGLGVARALGEALGGAGVVVVSGLARGIDHAAHTGALCAGGVTVGVLGCGVDVTYPPEHRSLMEAMCRRGGVLAEEPLGTPPEARRFPPRNRLISGLAQAVVVVEGDMDSGAMITARYAAAQGRSVFAVPGSVYAPGSRGPHRLLAEGGARLLTAADDLAEILGLPPETLRCRPAAAVHIVSRGRRVVGTIEAPPADAQSEQPGMGRTTPAVEDHGTGLRAAETRVLAVLTDEAMHIDARGAGAGLPPPRPAAALAALEVRGLTRERPGKNFVRRTGPHPGADAAPTHAGGTM